MTAFNHTSLIYQTLDQEKKKIRAQKKQLPDLTFNQAAHEAYNFLAEYTGGDTAYVAYITRQKLYDLLNQDKTFVDSGMAI